MPESASGALTHSLDSLFGAVFNEDGNFAERGSQLLLERDRINCGLDLHPENLTRYSRTN